MIRPDYVAFLQARQSLSSTKERLVVNKEKAGRQQRKGWSPKKKRLVTKKEKAGRTRP